MYISFFLFFFLLYSTGNFIQYPVMENNLNIYMNHFSVYLKPTQHCKSTILQQQKKIPRTSQYNKVTASHTLWMNTWWVPIEMHWNWKIYAELYIFSTKKVKHLVNNFYVNHMLKWQCFNKMSLIKIIKIKFPCLFLPF